MAFFDSNKKGVLPSDIELDLPPEPPEMTDDDFSLEGPINEELASLDKPTLENVKTAKDEVLPGLPPLPDIEEDLKSLPDEERWGKLPELKEEGLPDLSEKPEEKGELDLPPPPEIKAGKKEKKVEEPGKKTNKKLIWYSIGAVLLLGIVYSIYKYKTYYVSAGNYIVSFFRILLIRIVSLFNRLKFYAGNYPTYSIVAGVVLLAIIIVVVMILMKKKEKGVKDKKGLFSYLKLKKTTEIAELPPLPEEVHEMPEAPEKGMEFPEIPPLPEATGEVHKMPPVTSKEEVYAPPKIEVPAPQAVEPLKVEEEIPKIKAEPAVEEIPDIRAEPAVKPIKKEKFITITEFKQIRGDLSNTKGILKNVGSFFSKLEKVKSIEDKEYLELCGSLQDIHEKIMFINKTLFKEENI